jgi:hypothetical protein
MCAMCIEQSLIDITTHRLTRSVTMRAAFIGGPLLSIAAIANNQPGKIGVMALSFTATLLTFMTLSLASKRGIGAGDVRLAQNDGLKKSYVMIHGFGQIFPYLRTSKFVSLFEGKVTNFKLILF